MIAEEWDIPAVDDHELSWKVDALCAQVDPELFFPENGRSARNAKSICADCDIREKCLSYAIEHDEEFGIWGGLSERERRKLWKGTYVPREPKPVKLPERPQRPVLRHGTDTMWRRGCRTVVECPRSAEGLTCVQAHREFRQGVTAARRAKRDAA